MDTYLQLPLQAIQMGLAGYALTWSYKAITNLKQYEEKSEKAAEWLETAEIRLRKTRETQASGAFALLMSFASSAYFLFEKRNPSAEKLSLRLFWAAVVFAAKKHQDSFWHDKAMIPFVKGYNDGIKSTGMTRTYLGYLTVGWIASAAIEAAGLFSQ